MFPVSHCETCETERLTYGDVVEDQIVRKCLNCDSPIASEIDWRTADETTELGYAIEGHQPPSEKRGCKDGACGVQQPLSDV